MATWPSPEVFPWHTAVAAAVVLGALVLGGWAWHRPAVRGRVIAGGASALLGGALVLAFVDPAAIPTGWITVLQEGRSARSVRHLFGSATHAGAGFQALVDGLGSHGPTTLRVMVRANVCLAVVNTVVFVFLAAHVLRSWWAGLVFAVAFAANLNTIQAAFSETPAMVGTTHFLLACIAAAVISDRGAPLGLRGLALAWLGVLVILASGLRTEFLALGAPALAIGIAHVAGAEEWIRQATRRTGRHLRSIVAGPLAVFLLVGGGLLALEYVPVPVEHRYAVAGLRPLNFSFLTWLQTLALFFPFGIIALFLLGVIHGVRKWFAFFLLPIGLVILFKLYASASHSPFLDRFRYMAFVTPPVLFLALFGFRELSDWAARWSWPPWWKRAAMLLLVATFPAWNARGPREFFERRHQLPGVPTPEAFLALNEQTQVRYLLDLVARYPRCVFLVKTARADWARDPKTGYRWSAVGALVRRHAETDDAGHGVDRVAAELAPDAPCVLFYRSLDCDLVGLADCRAETEGRVPLEERVLENLPYSETAEYGAHRGEIRLAVYPVVVRDRGALAEAAGGSN